MAIKTYQIVVSEQMLLDWALLLQRVDNKVIDDASTGIGCDRVDVEGMIQLTLEAAYDKDTLHSFVV